MASSLAFVVCPKTYTATRQSFVCTVLHDAPPATSAAADVEEVDIPSVLPSEVGMDYVPLATHLATGQLAKADQVRCPFDAKFPFLAAITSVTIIFS